MISYIKGTIVYKGTGYILVNTGSLGYKIFVTPEILDWPLHETIELYTYLKIADDSHTLFGLKDIRSLEFFELLITVTGVGPKMALTIVSAAKIDILEDAISAGDTDIFTRMSGVGRKTAERIILELKNKVSSLGKSSSTGGSDIYDALISLGYSTKEVRDTLPLIDTQLPSEAQLKQALKYLSK